MNDTFQTCCELFYHFPSIKVTACRHQPEILSKLKDMVRIHSRWQFLYTEVDDALKRAHQELPPFEWAPSKDVIVCRDVGRIACHYFVSLQSDEIVQEIFLQLGEFGYDMNTIIEAAEEGLDFEFKTEEGHAKQTTLLKYVTDFYQRLPVYSIPEGFLERVNRECRYVEDREVRERPLSLDQKMLLEIQSNPDTRGRTSTQWARHFKVTTSAVCQTPTWGRLSELRDELKAQKQLRKARRT